MSKTKIKLKDQPYGYSYDYYGEKDFYQIVCINGKNKFKLFMGNREIGFFTIQQIKKMIEQEKNFYM